MYIQTFSGVAVNHCEHSQLAPVKHVICYKVHAPDLVDVQRQLLRLSAAELLCCALDAFAAMTNPAPGTAYKRDYGCL